MRRQALTMSFWTAAPYRAECTIIGYRPGSTRRRRNCCLSASLSMRGTPVYLVPPLRVGTQMSAAPRPWTLERPNIRSHGDRGSERDLKVAPTDASGLVVPRPKGRAYRRFGLGSRSLQAAYVRFDRSPDVGATHASPERVIESSELPGGACPAPTRARALQVTPTEGSGLVAAAFRLRLIGLTGRLT